jgi:hypothetical protein
MGLGSTRSTVYNGMLCVLYIEPLLQVGIQEPNTLFQLADLIYTF